MSRKPIKLIAIGAMTVDHIAFMLAEGFRYTRSRPKYLLRLSAFVLISQPFYFRMLFGRAPASVLEYLTHWNVMFTLAVALLSLMLLKSKIPTVPRLILVGVCISLAQFGDWSFMIPVWTIIFHVFRDDRKKQTMFFMLASLVMIYGLMLLDPESTLALSYQFGTLLALLPIRLYNGECGSVQQNAKSKWLYYLYYPLHMSMITILH